MPSFTTVQAAARMTPRMAAHQVKRLARNRLVPRFPARYDALIARDAARLPAPERLEAIPPALARFIGAFYAEHEEAMTDAARGRFTLLGRTVEFGSIEAIDWDHRLPEEKDHNLWRMKLTQLEIVHSLLASGERRHQDTAVRLLAAIAASRSFASPAAFKTAWAPYGVSHRLLAMLSGLALAAAADRLPADILREVGCFARSDAAFLWRNIEHDLRNNHTERNLAALCLYHMAAGTIGRARSRGLDGDIRALVRATVLPDGTQIERSAMYQGLTVMSLRVFAATPFLAAATRALCAERGDAAERAWAFLAHEDGGIALFNDSWIGEMPPPREIFGDAAPAPPAALPDGGYYRVAGDGVAALMDAGAIGPRWNPGHGHADFLALEIDVAGRRFLVDPGTSQYSTGARRSLERSAASHNGPRYVGVEPVDYAGCFKVGRLAAARPLDPALLAGAIGGMLATAAGAIARIVAPLPEGGLLVVDRWAAAAPRGAVALLLPATWLIEERGGSGLRARDGDATAVLRVHRGTLGQPTAAEWCRCFMAPEAATAIELLAVATGAAQSCAFSVSSGGATADAELVDALDGVLARALAS